MRLQKRSGRNKRVRLSSILHRTNTSIYSFIFICFPTRCVCCHGRIWARASPGLVLIWFLCKLWVFVVAEQESFHQSGEKQATWQLGERHALFIYTNTSRASHTHTLESGSDVSEMRLSVSNVGSEAGLEVAQLYAPLRSVSGDRSGFLSALSCGCSSGRRRMSSSPSWRERGLWWKPYLYHYLDRRITSNWFPECCVETWNFASSHTDQKSLI